MKREQRERPEYTFLVRVKCHYPSASRERIRVILLDFLQDGFEEGQLFGVIGVGHCGKTHQVKDVMEP